jgi:hypothetical protein
MLQQQQQQKCSGKKQKKLSNYRKGARVFEVVSTSKHLGHIKPVGGGQASSFVTKRVQPTFSSHPNGKATKKPEPIVLKPVVHRGEKPRPEKRKADRRRQL